MTWTVNTGCKYHTQDTYYYCGAACAMMVLAEIGVPYADLDQDVLYTSNHDHNAQPGWYTDPEGLRFTLVDRRPAGFTNTFVVFKPTTELEGTRKIVHTLRVYGVSPSALVYGCGHWIVIRGVQTDVDPNSGPYTVDGFWVNNPAWYSSSPPPPHTATDICGSGGALGIENEFVSYAAWQSTYFTGCNYDDPGSLNQFISVCDPEVPKIQLPRRRPEKRLASGRKLLSMNQAIEFAEVGLNEYQLFKNELSARALKAGKPGQPQLVLRLDRPDSYYYLVPWQRAESPMAFVQVDARFGLFNSLQLLSSPMKERLLSREVLDKRLSGAKLELPEKMGRFVLRPDTYCVSPTLVWMPCRESFSPNLPFYQVTLGNLQFYVRLDGMVFSELTPTALGD
jgi:hypothetical protein